MRIFSGKLLLICMPLVLLLVLFGGFVSEGDVLLTTDAIIRASNTSFTETLREAIPYWSSEKLLGSPSAGRTGVSAILRAVFTTGVGWNNWNQGMGSLLTSFALIYFLRKVQLKSAGVALCVVAACWLGSNFTLLYGGHPNKFFILLFFVLSLIFAGKFGVYGALLWGGCVGLMFVQQPDVALFFALFSGAYLLFRLWQAQGLKPLKWMKVLAPALIFAFLFAAGPLLSGYKHHVKGSAQMQTSNPQEKWNYITQWSLPPQEVIQFVAPCYFGWRSGEPEGPYWGRMGRSSGWEESGQGFRNFQLDNPYIGIIPIAFAVFALFGCWETKRRAEVLFWSFAALTALWISMGKFSILYKLFYQLPIVNNIRAPVKFVQVFQMAVGILAAYGLDSLFQKKTETNGGVFNTKPSRTFFLIITSCFSILLVVVLVLLFKKPADMASFVSQGWAQAAAETIVGNRISAVWHAVFMAALVAVTFAVFGFQKLEKVRRFGNWIAVALVLVVATDAVKLSKHYIKEMPQSYIKANVLTDFLKADIGRQRVAFLSQQGINNIWITYLMPYNRILTFNFTDMPRMTPEYKTFLTAGQRDPLNMWRFSAVKYLLAPSGAEQQLVAAKCKKVFSYGLADAGHGEFNVVPHANGSLAVYELLGTLPRYALFAGAKKGTDEQALAGMSDFSKIILPEDSPLPELDGAGQVGSVDILSYRSGKVVLRVKTDVPSILRCADRFDEDWKATIDGKKADIERVDFLSQGVYISEGEHTVELWYAPSLHFLYMQCVGYLILFGALGALFLQRKGRHVAD